MKSRSKYPHSKSRILLSILMSALSLVLALLLLPTPALILYYFASTSIIVAITFLLKRRYLYTDTTGTHQGVSGENVEKRASWKLLIFLFLLMIAILVAPLFLASLLDPRAWFILVVSLTSGVSISEIALYAYMR